MKKLIVLIFALTIYSASAIMGCSNLLDEQNYLKYESLLCSAIHNSDGSTAVADLCFLQGMAIVPGTIGNMEFDNFANLAPIDVRLNMQSTRNNQLRRIQANLLGSETPILIVDNAMSYKNPFSDKIITKPITLSDYSSINPQRLRDGCVIAELTKEDFKGTECLRFSLSDETDFLTIYWISTEDNLIRAKDSTNKSGRLLSRTEYLSYIELGSGGHIANQTSQWSCSDLRRIWLEWILDIREEDIDDSFFSQKYLSQVSQR